MPTLLGNDTVGGGSPNYQDAGDCGCTQFTAIASGTAESIWQYVHSSATSTVDVYVALFDNNGSDLPGNRLVAAVLRTSVTPDAWNEWVLTETVELVEGTKYWFAYLPPEAGGVRYDYVDYATTGGRSVDLTGNLETIPSTSPGIKGGPWSNNPAIYVEGSLPVPPQVLRPDADTTTTGWTDTPLYSKINDESDATVITATLS